MGKRLLALFLLVNAVGVLVNLPRILDAVDGRAVGDALSTWVIGVSTAAGDLVEEMAAEVPDQAEVDAIQQDLRARPLDDPLDDESVAALASLWRLLREAGEALEAEELRDLLLERGVDPAEVPASPAPDDATPLP